MILWILRFLFRRGFNSQRGLTNLGEAENLARSGAAAWLLAQEKARLEFLAAKEAYCQTGSWGAFARLLERLLQLASTNAIVQSLLNEHAAEKLLTASAGDCRKSQALQLRKSA